MSVIKDLAIFFAMVKRALARRRKRRVWARFEQNRGPLPESHFRAAVYFADSLVNAYQFEQWEAPLVELAKTHAVAVITRNVETAVHLAASSSLPVVHLPKIADVEEWMAGQEVGAVFYLNQNARNFQMLRAREPAHIFLSHGESDKDYMASNQLKAYDYTFVAGDAARDRLRSRLRGFDVEQRTVKIGRPQIDVAWPAPLNLPDDGRTVVLYAPTWEGDRPTMSYSSVRTHAPSMVAALVTTGDHRVIYRPHPRTGAADRSYFEAHSEIVKILKRANSTDPKAQHVVDIDSTFGWHLEVADICIADISAIAFDWLATGKPVLLTRPSNDAAQVDETGIAGTLIDVSAEDSENIVELLAKANDPTRVGLRAVLVSRYYGDVSPGASMQRWLDAARDVLDKSSLECDGKNPLTARFNP